MEIVTEEKLDKYFSVTKQALDKVKILDKKMEIDCKKTAETFFEMALLYYQDALHFKKKGDYVTAFAALNYAHGWLDAGAMLGVFDVGRDNRLFTVD